MKYLIFICYLSFYISITGCNSTDDSSEIRSLQLKVNMLQDILSDKETLLKAKEEEQGLTGIVWDSEEVDGLQDQIQYLRQGIKVRKEIISKLDERLRIENNISN